MCTELTSLLFGVVHKMLSHSSRQTNALGGTVDREDLLDWPSMPQQPLGPSPLGYRVVGEGTRAQGVTLAHTVHHTFGLVLGRDMCFLSRQETRQ